MPTAQDAITELEWAQLAFDLEDRSKFDLTQVPKRIRDLDGSLVRVRGYLGYFDSTYDIKEFVLIGEVKSKPVDARKCHADRISIPLHYWMTVKMAAGKSTAYTSKPIAVVGRFSINVIEIQGEPICIFKLVGESVDCVKHRDGYGRAVADGC